MLKNAGHIVIPCSDLQAEADFFTQLGFILRQVYPADDPKMMLMTGYSLHLRLSRADPIAPMVIHLPAAVGEEPLTSPSGVKIDFHQDTKPVVVMPDHIDFTVNAFDASDSWVVGRAGMLYRDLIPGRLAGAMIASNIMIPQGGPVPDHVHYHSIQFQLIYCVKGWVKVVYEDQGEPFVLEAGDCVTQPPEIRHQVLEASDGLEVIEVGLPAVHMTTLDYAMNLPTGQQLPERIYHAPGYHPQTFCHHRRAQAHWQPWQSGHWQRCQTAVFTASAGYAELNVIKSNQAMQTAIEVQHHNTLRFYYLIHGQLELTDVNGYTRYLVARDSWVQPAEILSQWHDVSHDFECIELIIP